MRVTLLTDFGTADGFVGAMKGVIVSLAPDAVIHDITHDIAPQDISSGAWALRQAASFFPKDTIHVAVIDPGVGSKRRPLIAEINGHYFVAPDNGLISWVVGAHDRATRVWHVTQEKYGLRPISATFHGRDLFASIAGHLAMKTQPDECGVRFDDWQRLDWPTVAVSPKEIVGRVVHIDHFGNLITNIDEAMLMNNTEWWVYVGTRDIGSLRTTYADVDIGEWVGYIGSGRTVEVGIRNGSATSFGVNRGDEVRLRPLDTR